jgi:hypothetical protein
MKDPATISRVFFFITDADLIFQFAVSVSPARLTTQSPVQIPINLDKSVVLAARGPEWQHYKNRAGCAPLLATCDFRGPASIGAQSILRVT